MVENGHGFRRLISPISKASFFGEHWETKPLLVRRNSPDWYSEVFSLADVDEVIACTRPKFAGADLADPKPKTYVDGLLAGREMAPTAHYAGLTELRQAFEAGKTIVIRSMQQRRTAVAELCRSLEGLFQCPVHANLYLTPEGAQGFDAHFDTHDVFVLQLHGFKHWRLYGQGRKLPLPEDKTGVSRERLGKAEEVRLDAGDLLYLPRGWIHEAYTSQCRSLHLTIGVNVYPWAEVLHRALAAVTRRDARFRESIPPGALAGGDLPETVAARFRELLQTLAADASADTAFGMLGHEFFGELQPLPNGHFLPRDDGPIDLDTVLRKAPGAICRVNVSPAGAEIVFPGNRVGGPPHIEAALRFVAEAIEFPVRALPDGLSDGAKVVLAQRLVREGLLEIAGRAEPGEARAASADDPVEIAGNGSASEWSAPLTASK